MRQTGARLPAVLTIALLGAVLALVPVSAAEAQEVVRCKGKVATIIGDDTNDVITGTDGDDVIHAGAGNDIIEGGAGNDLICGGPGADTLDGGDGNDRLRGGGGRDTLLASRGLDVLNGGRGIDRCAGPSFGGRQTKSCVDETSADQTDLRRARRVLDRAKRKWAKWIETAGDDYRLSYWLSCECESVGVTSDVLDGVAYWSQVGRGDGQQPSFVPAERTVEDLLARAEALLTDLEANPDTAGDPDTGVGQFFSLTVDKGTGFPLVVGDNGPADGGADFIAVLGNVHRGEVVASLDPFDLYDLDMLALTNPVEGIDELISVVADDFDFADLNPEVITEHGEPCLAAPDATACQTSLDQLVTDLTIDDQPVIDWLCGLCPPTVAFMVARSGADLQVVPAADWPDALGPIDQPAEVAALFGRRTYVKAGAGTGFAAVTTDYLAECDPIVTRHVLYRIGTDPELGTLIDEKRISYELAYGVCI